MFCLASRPLGTTPFRCKSNRLRLLTSRMAIMEHAYYACEEALTGRPR